MKKTNIIQDKKEVVIQGCPFNDTNQNENGVLNSRLTLNAIPPKFLKWLVSSRVRFLDNLLEGQTMRLFSAHLPTMVTWNKGEDFPVNMTVKGIGLIPKEEHLTNYTELFEDTAKRALSSDWDESLSNRIGANKKLYDNINHFEPSLLGGLEIFEGTAFQNMKENPYVSLLYVGMIHNSNGMEYISFQVNGKVEIINKNNPYYKFLLSSRKLFEFDQFHLYQPDYPFGYLIKVKEVRNKSPFTRTDVNK